MKNITAEAAIAQLELLECTTDSADPVPQEPLTTNQAKSALQFAPTAPFGRTRIRNVCAPRTSSMSEEFALNAQEANYSIPPSKDVNQFATSDLSTILELINADLNVPRFKPTPTI